MSGHTTTETTTTQQLQACRDRLQQQLGYAKAISTLAQLAISHQDAVSLLNEMMQVVGRTLAVDRCLVYQVDFERARLECLSEWRPGYPQAQKPKAVGRYPMALFAEACAWMQRTRQVLVSQAGDMHEVMARSGVGPLMHLGAGVSSLLWLPFLFRPPGSVTPNFHVLALQMFTGERQWNEDEQAFIQECACVVAIGVERLESQQQLMASELRWQYALNGSGDGVWDWDLSQEQVYFSPRSLEMLSYDDAHGLLSPEVWMSKVHPQDRTQLRYELSRHLLGRTEDCRVEFRLMTGLGQYKWILGRGRVMVRDADGRPLRMVGTHSDITARRQQQERMHYLAFYDALTGLPNRALLQDRVQQALYLAKRDQSNLGVMFLDLDGFKRVNDSLGHQAGDALLQQAAERLRAELRDADSVARLGGDEFVVVLPEASMPDVERVALRILAALAQPFEVDEEAHQVNVTVSIGVAVYPGDGEDYSTLMKHADTAMYVAKGDGKNRIAFYDPGMQSLAKERLALDNAVRSALARDEFYLVFQPQIHLTSGSVTGAEALIRWKHPQLGLVPPSKFIPVVEENGLIMEIGQWVLEQAVRKQAYLRALGVDITLAVNVSARQFADPQFVAHVQDMLTTYEVPGSSLELELTESLLMRNVDQGMRVMQALTEIGVSWSVDDFGTGYSSLAYLRRFPLSKLKIDRSFVLDMAHGGESVVQTIINMGQSLNMTVIAEGVEEQGQLQMLQSMGCDRVQGYYFSPPVSAADLVGLLTMPDAMPSLAEMRKRLH